VQARLDKHGRLTEVCFDGKGCVISLAAASILMEEIEGKTLKEVKQLDRQVMLNLLGIPLTAMRVKCAMLALRTLEKAIHFYEGRGNEACAIKS
jgi:nitrogen fixation NifU-like protein